MADVKISALPAASTPLTGGEVLPIVQSGTTTKVAVSNLTAGLAGTASININGTVGATTPTTGAFTSGTFSTTLGVTGATTVAALTGSGVHTLNGAPTLGNAQLSINSNSGANTSYAGVVFVNSASSGGYITLADASNTGWYGAHAGDITIGGALGVGIKLRVNANDNLGLSISTAGAVTIPGTLGVTGTITPGQTTGIVGTTTNNDVQAGSVGEFISASVASGSAVTLTSDTAANVTTISLTAGDWDVSGVVLYLQPGTTSINNAFSGPSQTSATLGAVGSYSTIYNQGVTAADPAITSPVVRMSLSGTTTIYLVARSNFSVSTLKAYGFFSARRVR